MTVLTVTHDRHVIPRWRPFSVAVHTPELAPKEPLVITARADGPPEELEIDLARLRADPGIHMAADLLEQALMAPGAEPIAEEAIVFLRSSPNATAASRHLAMRASSLLSGSRPVADGFDVRTLTRDSRAYLRFAPNDPLAWIDLAYAQTITGQLARARRSVRTGVALARGNRFTVRSATAFFVHAGMIEDAWAVADSSGVAGSDPWIGAAEIATASQLGQTSRRVREWRRLLLNNSIAASQQTELAAAISSVEFDWGSDRKGRRMLDRALRSPTENAVAQAEFEAQRGSFILPQSILETPGSHEARTIERCTAGEWTEAQDAAISWQADQPFSQRAALFVSYLSSIATENFEVAAQAADLGLQSSPGEPMLSNNLAFALASLGKIDDANRVLRSSRPIDSDAPEDVSFRATRGLIAYRSGLVSEGRSRYADAVRLADAATGQRALAQAYWFTCEVGVGWAFDRELARSLHSSVSRAGVPEAGIVMERAIARLEETDRRAIVSEGR